MLVLAHQGMGAILFSLGDFTLAREHLEQALTFYDSQQHNPYSSQLPQDPGIVSLAYLAWTLWYLGYPEQALKKKSEALTLAHELSHPPSLIWALNLAAKVHLWRREAPAVLQQVEPMLQLANKHGIPYWLAEGTMLRGWVLTEQGEVQEGITQMRQGLVAWRAMGARVAASYFLSLPIVAYGKGGQVEEGLSILTEALDIVHNTGERVYEAELYRLKGELLLNDERRTMNDEWRTPEAKASLHAAEAEVCFQRAIEVARSQQAKS
jgi:predicted ATPase